MKFLSHSIRKCVPKRNLKTVYDRDTKFSDTRNPSYYYTIWLEGCMNQREPRMWPAITKNKRKKRRPAMKSLLAKIEDFVGSDGCVVIAGFDFGIEDERLTSTLAEIIEDNLPSKSSYWFPFDASDVPSSIKELEEDELLNRISETTFINFLKELPDDITTGNSSAKERTVRTSYGHIELTEREYRLFKGSLIILTEDILNTFRLPTKSGTD